MKQPRMGPGRRRVGAAVVTLVAVAAVVVVVFGGSSQASSPLVAGRPLQQGTVPSPSSVVSACGKQISINNVNAKLPIQKPNCYYQNIPRAKCGPGSNPETGFQGEVTMAERNAGFQGTSCNLQLVSQVQGQGASWQEAWSGTCEYYDQALPATPGSKSNGVSVGTYTGTKLENPGVVVVNVKNPKNPVVTGHLATPGMVHPWEDLKVNPKRKLLAGQLQAGAPLDVYSVKNCAQPKLLSSTPLKDFGHEGEWEPDGQTYWAAYPSNSEYHAVNMSNPAHPKEILDWKLPDPKDHNSHGMSFSADGKTAYFTFISGALSNPQKSTPVADDGFVIADISSIQDRSPHPQVKVLSTVSFVDGGVAQHTISFTEHGVKYLVFVDELGAEGLGDPKNWNNAVKAGLPPFGVARIFNVNNPRKPFLVSRLTLQTDKPSNWQKAVHEVTAGGQTVFSYDSHYCAIDRPVNATALACGYFNSGVRVFDIRNPAKPKEVAYYDPPSAQSKMKDLAGSEHSQTETGAKLTKNGLSADWCSSQSRFFDYKGTQYLWIQCQDNGFQVLKFTNNTFPLTNKN